MSITQDCQPQLYTGILVIMLPNQLLYRHGDRQSQRSHSGGEGYERHSSSTGATRDYNQKIR